MDLAQDLSLYGHLWRSRPATSHTSGADAESFKQSWERFEKLHKYEIGACEPKHRSLARTKDSNGKHSSVRHGQTSASA